MGKGFFISFEGGEGAGKTTQIDAIAAWLTAEGRDVIRTREPGGTPEAEKLRALLAQRDGGNWTPEAETLLFFAARHVHVTSLIRPALECGQIVICDRFTDSTRAYQSYAHGQDITFIETINHAVLKDFEPDLTFIFDIDPRLGLARSANRQEASGIDNGTSEDRFEKLDLGFHIKVRDGFLDIARRNPQRCIVIDASLSPEEVTQILIKALKAGGI